MGLRINTNIQALSAQRFMGINYDAQKSSLDHLSSGSRINKAADDAAGLAISERLKANIRSMRQAIRNTGDGVSMIQVAEGSFNEISNILIRFRELSIQGASDTIGDVERGFIDKEVQQLKDEVNRIAQTTEFNGSKLLNGDIPVVDVQVGLHNNPLEDRFGIDTSTLTTSTDSLGLSDMNLLSKESSQNNLDMIDSAIEKINSNRATLGALQNRMQSTINNSMIYAENLEQANSRIRDTDIATESSMLTRNNILTQQTVAVLAQANQVPMLALKLLG